MTLPRGTTSLADDALLRLAKAVGSDDTLLLYAGDWLAHLNLFSDAQLYDILRFVKPAIEQTTDRPLETAPLLFVAGYRWVGATGLDRLWDANLAEECDMCLNRVVTYISCDIMALRTFAEQQERTYAELSS